MPAGWPSDRDALLAMPGWTEWINTDTSTMSGTGDYEAVNEIGESQQTYCTFGRRSNAVFDLQTIGDVTSPINTYDMLATSAHIHVYFIRASSNLVL